MGKQRVKSQRVFQVTSLFSVLLPAQGLPGLPGPPGVKGQKGIPYTAAIKGESHVCDKQLGPVTIRTVGVCHRSDMLLIACPLGSLCCCLALLKDPVFFPGIKGDLGFPGSIGHHGLPGPDGIPGARGVRGDHGLPVAQRLLLIAVHATDRRGSFFPDTLYRSDFFDSTGGHLSRISG